jgi:hypothetical protein
VSAIDSNGRTIWIADAHRDDRKRFVVRADELLTAFLELQVAIIVSPHRDKAPTAQAPDAQLTAPASHLPTPRAKS